MKKDELSYDLKATLDINKDIINKLLSSKKEILHNFDSIENFVHLNANLYKQNNDLLKDRNLLLYEVIFTRQSRNQI